MRLPSLFRAETRLPVFRRFFGEDFEKLFEDFFARTRLPARAEGGEAAFVPDIDLVEREKDYLVRAELPGVALEDIEVTVVGEDILQIKGEKKTEKEEKGESSYVCERTYGSFLRQVPLPMPIRAEKIEAKLEKGILEVLLPKAEAVKPKKVEVKGNGG